MKNFRYIFVAFLVFNSITAQQVINTEFKTKTLQVFQNLDKNRVPYGILLDFGMEFTNLKAFNGTLTDSTYTTSQTLSNSYKTLLMCRVRSDATTGFITPLDYATRWYSQRSLGIITLSGQYFKYNCFAATAYPSKINYSNNQFSDKLVNGVWQNPYEEKQLFVMAPSISHYQGLNFQVQLPSNLFLSNYPATVQNIQVDFSDGSGFQTVAFDELIDVNYPQPNTYIWKYKITLTNGETLLSHSKIVIEEGLNAAPYANPKPAFEPQLTASADLSAYQKININASTPYGTGLFALGSATLYIRYKTGGHTITKPLIVAEGFDTGQFLKPEQEAGDNNIDLFLRNINNSSSSLPLETDKYDVIYVDWNNGIDFIQKNAYMLEAVIKWVNAQKALNGSTLQNVVLGQSMGGLVARYALKDMENKGLNHDTRLYISHDAPHLGANVPVSLQLSARHLRNLYISTPIPFLTGEVVLPLIFDFAQGFSQIINLFGGSTTVDSYITPLEAFSLADCPAARQMQYNWVNTNYQINNTIHDAWQQELVTLGYPVGYPAQGKPIRNIAIANGSECGATQPDQGNIMSYIKDAGRDTVLSDYIGIMDAIYGTLLLNPLVVVTSLFPGSSYWEMDFQSKYMTTLNENKTIYHGSIIYKKKIFWLIPVSVWITNRDDRQPSDILPYDIYGGGQQFPPTSSVPIADIAGNYFGFMPTASALAIGKGTTALNDNDYRKSYIGALPPVLPKNSPFDNFVTHFNLNDPGSNSIHLSFNRRNGNWLRTELDASLPDEYTNCSYRCSDAPITGPTNFCTSANLAAPIGALYYNWHISQGANLVTLTGNGTPNVTLTALPNASGTIEINLSMGDNGTKCGSRYITKFIWVGKPSFTFEYTYYDIQPIKSTLCVVSTDPTISLEQQGVTSVTFTGVRNFNAFCIRTTSPYCKEATVTNACGSVKMKNDCVPFKQSASNASAILDYYTLSPNPSNDVVAIALVDQNNLPEKGAVITGELFNMMGISQSKVEIKDNKATFSVKGLNHGIYVLKIYINDQVESHQIAVE